MICRTTPKAHWFWNPQMKTSPQNSISAVPCLPNVKLQFNHDCVSAPVRYFLARPKPKNRTTNMRFANLMRLVASWAASASILAGTYPPGNFTQSFDQPAGTVDLLDGSVIGSEQKTAEGLPIA